RLRQFPTPRSRHPPIQIPSRFGKNQDQTIHDETRRKLERISGGFTAVRWGVAYGSGVFDQVGYASRGLNGIPSPDSTTKTRKEQPLVDFLFSTSHPSHFHAINLQKNPEHYPRLFRWLGPEAIARVQEWGGGVWFVTDVDTVRIKYGIISTDALCTDLLDWTTLYVSGRLHKPVRIVKGAADRRVLVAAQVNLTSALRVALLQLPETFTERELWEQVAGISYSGDPRMSIPGAENPHKVKNIVAPQMHRFRGLYGRLLSGMGGVRPADEEKQDKSISYRADLLSKLPRTLRRSIATHYCTQFNVQMLKPGEEPQEGGPTALTGDDFWKKVAGVDEADLRAVLSRALKGIMGKPALRQSFKGLLTAGFSKSMVYAGRKVGKWWKAKVSDGSP
ncbi:Mmp37-domain-containing protein, partial [Filobasidium floriforme]|uniref:Mmp37-domain-containing protein n=1 Tax=Filobasidium floriforme TaxID=5210 RepID=UPI001E8D71B9